LNLIETLKYQISEVSMKLTKRPYDIDTTKLNSMVGRFKLMHKMKELSL